jgi:hypothetical protein
VHVCVCVCVWQALEEGSSPRRSSVRDSGFGDSWYSDREELFQLRGGGRGGEGGGEGYSKEDSSDSLDSLGSRPHSISSDATLKGSSEGRKTHTHVHSRMHICTLRSHTGKHTHTHTHKTVFLG